MKLTLLQLILDAAPLQKVIIALIILGLVAAGLLAYVSKNPAKAAIQIEAIRSASLFAGFLGALMTLLGGFMAVANINIFNVVVMSPGLAEAIFMAALGVFGAMAASLALGVARLRLSHPASV